jgi:hypothetical protein
MKDKTKIGTVGGTSGRERMNEGVWLMDFIYVHEIEQRNLLQLLLVGRGGDGVGREDGGDLTELSDRTVTMDPPCIMNIS